MLNSCNDSLQVPLSQAKVTKSDFLLASEHLRPSHTW